MPRRTRRFQPWGRRGVAAASATVPNSSRRRRERRGPRNRGPSGTGTPTARRIGTSACRATRSSGTTGSRSRRGASLANGYPLGGLRPPLKPFTPFTPHPPPPHTHHSFCVATLLGVRSGEVGCSRGVALAAKTQSGHIQVTVRSQSGHIQVTFRSCNLQ